MQWFRMYAEAVDDEKLRLLAFEDRWHFVALLCCKSTGVLDGDDADLRRRKVAVKLGLDFRELDEVARRLEEVGLICAETFQPLAWDNRQFVSDHDPTARDRLKKYREKKKLESATDMKRVAVPLLQRTCNGNETRSEQNRTEAETEKAISSESADSAAPAGKGKGPPPCPYDAIVDAYHETLPVLSRVVMLTPARKAHISARWREVWDDERFEQAGGVDLFRGYFRRVASSRFLTGKVNGANGKPPFKADLEWLMKPGNFAKVLEGKYE